MSWYSIPPALVDVDDRLANWGRWAFERNRRGRARSIEGRYQPEQLRGDAEEDRRVASVFVDQLDASVVDRALAVAGGCPRRESLLLKLHYVERMSDESIRRQVRVHRNDWDQVVAYALRMAMNRLERRSVQPSASRRTVGPRIAWHTAALATG